MIKQQSFHAICNPALAERDREMDEQLLKKITGCFNRRSTSIPMSLTYILVNSSEGAGAGLSCKTKLIQLIEQQFLL